MKKISILLILSVFIIQCQDDKSKQKRTDDTGSKIDKIYKLAIIDAMEQEPYKSTRESMLLFLKKNGYEEGKNLQIFYSSIGNDDKTGTQTLKEMISREPDIIFLQGTITVIVAQKSEYFNDPKYKFVFACVTDPVEVGLVDNLGVVPKYNFTGVTYPVPATVRLKFVKDLIPGLKKIGLIYPDLPQSNTYKKWINDSIKEDPELKGIQVIYRSIPLITGEDGPKKMTDSAKNMCRN